MLYERIVPEAFQRAQVTEDTESFQFAVDPHAADGYRFRPPVLFNSKVYCPFSISLSINPDYLAPRRHCGLWSADASQS